MWETASCPTLKDKCCLRSGIIVREKNYSIQFKAELGLQSCLLALTVAVKDNLVSKDAVRYLDFLESYILFLIC